MAKLRGGRVIATTSTDEKAALASEAGADHVIGYENFRERVREISDGEGMAAIYDGVGKATFLDGLEALAPTGRMILYGAASARPDPLDVQLLAARGSLYGPAADDCDLHPPGPRSCCAIAQSACSN